MNDNMNFSQQKDLFNPASARPVTIMGAGSVGSLLTYLLTKKGVSDITIYDADEVSSHNCPMSAYRPDDVGMFKVQALKGLISSHSNTEIKVIQKMYEGERLTGTVVCCVDTMEARKLIWSRVRDNPNVDALIDTRLALKFISVFGIRPCDPEDIAYYEHFLYSSDTAVKPTCGEHGVIDVAMTTALLACRNLTELWLSGRMRRHQNGLVGELEFFEPEPQQQEAADGEGQEAEQQEEDGDVDVRPIEGQDIQQGR